MMQYANARLAGAVLACLLTMPFLGGLTLRTASADTAAKYYCINGTYPTSWGISQYPTAPEGMRCFNSLDALYSALNLPSVAFWNDLPTYTDTNVPAPGMFDATDCRLIGWRGMRLLPGEVYWGRCTNKLMVSFQGPAPGPDQMWWAPPPHVSFAQARQLGVRIPKLLAVRASLRLSPLPPGAYHPHVYCSGPAASSGQVHEYPQPRPGMTCWSEYFCVDPTSNWGVREVSQPDPALACFDTIEEAFSAIGIQYNCSTSVPESGAPATVTTECPGGIVVTATRSAP